MVHTKKRALVKLRNDRGYRTGIRLARVANVVGLAFLLWSFAFADGPESTRSMFTAVWLISAATLVPALLLMSGAVARHTGRSLFKQRGTDVERAVYRDLFTPLPRYVEGD